MLEYLRNHKYTLPLTHTHTHTHTSHLNTLSGFSVNGSAQEYRAFAKREREGRREEEFNSNFKDYTQCTIVCWYISEKKKEVYDGSMKFIKKSIFTQMLIK